jgi:hypothetical protein
MRKKIQKKKTKIMPTFNRKRMQKITPDPVLLGERRAVDPSAPNPSKQEDSRLAMPVPDSR